MSWTPDSFSLYLLGSETFHFYFVVFFYTRKYMWHLIIFVIYRCRCSNCSLMPTLTECVCCQSIDKVKLKCQELEEVELPPVQCIVQHPGFSSVCLDVWVLQTVYNEYRQAHGDLHKPLHEYVIYLTISRVGGNMNSLPSILNPLFFCVLLWRVFIHGY